VKEKDFEKMAKLSHEDGNAESNPIQGKEQDIINHFQSCILRCIKKPFVLSVNACANGFLAPLRTRKL